MIIDPRDATPGYEKAAKGFLTGKVTSGELAQEASRARRVTASKVGTREETRIPLRIPGRSIPSPVAAIPQTVAINEEAHPDIIPDSQGARRMPSTGVTAMPHQIINQNHAGSGHIYNVYNNNGTLAHQSEGEVAEHEGESGSGTGSGNSVDEDLRLLNPNIATPFNRGRTLAENGVNAAINIFNGSKAAEHQHRQLGN